MRGVYSTSLIATWYNQQLVDMRLSGEPIDLVTVTAKLFETGHISHISRSLKGLAKELKIPVSFLRLLWSGMNETIP